MASSEDAYVRVARSRAVQGRAAFERGFGRLKASARLPPTHGLDRVSIHANLVMVARLGQRSVAYGRFPWRRRRVILSDDFHEVERVEVLPVTQ